MKIVIFLLLVGCKNISIPKVEVSPYVDKSEIKCMDHLNQPTYQAIIETYKIHYPVWNDPFWMIDTDQGPLRLTGSCYTRQLNY